jgi:hypothetical protein
VRRSYFEQSRQIRNLVLSVRIHLYGMCKALGKSSSKPGFHCATFSLVFLVANKRCSRSVFPQQGLERVERLVGAGVIDNDHGQFACDETWEQWAKLLDVVVMRDNETGAHSGVFRKYENAAGVRTAMAGNVEADPGCFQRLEPQFY